MSEFSLVEEHNKFLKGEDLGLSSYRPGLWPSEASVSYIKDDRKVVHGACLRSVWYKSKGYKKGPRSAGLAMKAKVGKVVERMLVEDFKNMGIYKDNNVKFWNPEFGISGELDTVISPKDSGKLIMEEIKSYYGHYANMLICGYKRPPIPGKPKIDQFLQAITYAHVFGDKIDEYRMLYFERGDGHRVEFEVGLEPIGTMGEKEDYRPFWRQIPGPYWNTFEQDYVPQPFLFSDMVNRWKDLVGYIKENVLPPRDYDKVYDDKTVQWLWDHGEIGKTKYGDWQKSKKKNPLGDWQCNGYCDYQAHCERDCTGE
jgi:hypothetical protein